MDEIHFYRTDSTRCPMGLTSSAEDHAVPIALLEQWVGARRPATAGPTCLAGHSVSAVVTLRPPLPLSHVGPHQGSMLAPFLFSFPTLGSIPSKNGILFHCYADDSQICVPLKQADSFLVSGPSTICLQLVQNAAAHLLTGTRKSGHVSSILTPLATCPFLELI